MSLDVILTQVEAVEVYSANITHNLNSMAEAAGLYQFLWRPEEIGITKAEELIGPLTLGLIELETRPDKYLKLNPENGWGTYEGLIDFVKNYLKACQEHPNAKVEASR